MRDDVVFVHPFIQQSIKVKLLAGVWAFPAQVFGDARLSNQTGRHGNTSPPADLFNFGGDTFEVTQATVHIGFLLLARPSR